MIFRISLLQVIKEDTIRVSYLEWRRERDGWREVGTLNYMHLLSIFLQDRPEGESILFGNPQRYAFIEPFFFFFYAGRLECQCPKFSVLDKPRKQHLGFA